MCSSANTGPDDCEITTSNENFYIRVLAYDALSSVILTINGRNVANVSKVSEPEVTTELSTTVSPSLTETIRKLIYFIYILYTLHGKPAACPAPV